MLQGHILMLQGLHIIVRAKYMCMESDFVEYMEVIAIVDDVMIFVHYRA